LRAALEVGIVAVRPTPAVLSESTNAELREMEIPVPCGAPAVVIEANAKLREFVLRGRQP
jgi:hypothetical protein